MRQTTLFVLLALLLCSAVAAQTPRLGAGVFGGLNIPIAQDDQASGSVFGIRGRIQLLPILVAEPNFLISNWGAPDAIDGVDLGIDGSKITGFGLDVTLGGGMVGVGFKPFLIAGLGSFKVENDETGYDESNFGFKGGLGFGIGLTPRFGFDVRATALIIPQEDGGSKKGALIVGGVNVNL